MKLPIIFTILMCSLPLMAQRDNTATSTQKTQPALVTFVDNGMTLAGGLPGQKSQAFRGKLFVENQLLAEMQPSSFITFEFEPVEVEFTAQTWVATGPSGGAHLTLTLVAGKHYFIELRTKQGWPFTKMFGIKEITCQQAQKEHEQDKPLDRTQVKVTGDPVALVEVSFPPCS
jgi:hypothetical protein